jgi:hypothetical protein
MKHRFRGGRVEAPILEAEFHLDAAGLADDYAGEFAGVAGYF